MRFHTTDEFADEFTNSCAETAGFDGDPFAPSLARLAGDVMALNAASKSLLREICEYVTLGGGSECSVALARLALRLQRSRTWVQTQMKALETSGLITIVARRMGGSPGDTPIYRLDRGLLRIMAYEGHRVLTKRLGKFRDDKAHASRVRKAAWERRQEADDEPVVFGLEEFDVGIPPDYSEIDGRDSEPDSRPGVLVNSVAE